MLQDKRGRTSTSGNVGIDGVVGKTFSRRKSDNIGCSRRSDRNYRMGSATEMMINDLDDERTLDEEEALEGSEDSHNELSNLQKEGDMPLKELLAKYGYSERSAENSEGSDQMNMMQDEERLESIGKDGALREEYEEEEEEEEEDEEEVEDEEEDEEDDGNGVKPKLSGDKMFKQLSLREFYLEMIKMDAKRICIAAGDNAGEDASGENVEETRKETEASLANRGEMLDDKHVRSRMNDGTTSNNENSSSQSGGNRLGGSDGGSDRVNDGTASNNENSSSRSGANPVGGPGGSSGGAEGGGSGGGGGGGGGGGSSRLLRSVSRPQSEEEDDDCDYSPDEEEWKKTIMVGSDYQATIPEGLCKYDDALPYENEDKILWNPCFISKKEVEEFLERAQLPNAKSTNTNTTIITTNTTAGTTHSLPTGGHIRDDEQALYLLLQCGYNLEEALRRRRMNVLPPTDAISLWSEEECHNFESGLRTYGKDFHLIQRNKVRTRSVGELVQFYYLWKKTERHDIFTYKARMEKKKYALHPGITDYMDRFLEEQEGVRDRSSSPNVNCLLYGDAKRQRGSVNTLANNHSEEVKSVETWEGVTTDESLGDVNNMNMSTGTTTTTTTSTAGGTASGNMSSTTSSSPLVSSASVTSVSGTKMSESSAAGTTASSNATNRKSVDGVSTNHNHDTPRHGYSPSPETILSNLPP